MSLPNQFMACKIAIGAPLEPSTMIQGPKLTFFMQAPTGNWNFFQSPDGKMWLQKGSIKFFLFSEKHKNAKFPKTFLHMKIFLLLNNRKITHHWLWNLSTVESQRKTCAAKRLLQTHKIKDLRWSRSSGFDITAYFFPDSPCTVVTQSKLLMGHRHSGI